MYVDHKLLEKKLLNFTDYLRNEVKIKVDFLGNPWLEGQCDYVQSKEFDRVSYLFQNLFLQSYFPKYVCVKDWRSGVTLDYSYGVSTIVSMLSQKFRDFSRLSQVNRRFFHSSRIDDFEGLWSELILIHYLLIQGIEVEHIKADKANKTPDLIMKNENKLYFIVVKTFTDQKFYNTNLTGFGSFKLTSRDATHIQRRIREASKQLNGYPRRIIAIDISFFYEAVSTYYANYLLGKPDFLVQLRNWVSEKGGLFLFLRAPYTNLLSQTQVIFEK